jgi:NTP pyrophosphatase (non-canonical NTP hydrolase)
MNNNNNIVSSIKMENGKPARTQKLTNKAYQDFCVNTASKPTTDKDVLIDRINELSENANISMLMTAALGLSAESGEFTEIVKKAVFQGKPLNDDNIYHLKRELGDICWYLANACESLGTTFDEIIQMNFDKLKARFPDGFTVEKSENRNAGDL